jgi:hypothetical protein
MVASASVIIISLPSNDSEVLVSTAISQPTIEDLLLRRHVGNDRKCNQLANHRPCMSINSSLQQNIVQQNTGGGGAAAAGMIVKQKTEPFLNQYAVHRYTCTNF